MNQGPRNLQEGKTLTDIADALMGGDMLRGLMLTVARLKALTEVSAPDSAGWAVARHHELVVVDDMGLLSRRDRENAARDHKQAQRLGQLSRGRGAMHVDDPGGRAR